ncbi:MAG: aminoacyl-tRNA hydrolase [Ardenticatenaceae bacterium]|nr:aminoacyl-tRNA hydrolase [Ardenticatenaceae bacterium]
MNDRFLIVGLGNPGRQYRGNRHNIGFMVVDRLAAANGIALGKVQSKAILGDGRFANQRIILAKPQTYMNGSGDAVGPLANFYKIPPDHIFVVYDEMDIAFGTIRLREKGGAGGHNGMKSLIQHIGQEFPRMRLGVGRPPGRMDPPAYLLQDFDKEQMPVVNDMIDEAIRAIATYLNEGIQVAMNRHNGSVNSDP